VNRFVSRVLEIKAGQSTLYEGNIEDYLNKLKTLQERETASRIEEDKATLTEQPAKQKGKAARQEQARIRQEKSKNLSPLKKEVARTEEVISHLETRKKELEQLMADPQLYQEQDKFAECSKEYNSLDRKLKRLYRSWEEIQAKIEAVESEFEDIC
jgi:ATP-binding cassette subfamily F protein 3